MTRKMSRRIVIDASVARSAGTTEEHPTSRRCRQFLGAVLEICHHMVFTEEVEQEWKKHRSPFAIRWQATMESKRKVDRITAQLDIRPGILSALTTEARRAAMLKDAHLVAAAMASDGVIASGDKKARSYFAKIAPQVEGLGKVAWVDVGYSDDDALKWAEAGARTETGRRLGAKRSFNAGGTGH